MGPPLQVGFRRQTPYAFRGGNQLAFSIRKSEESTQTCGARFERKFPSPFLSAEPKNKFNSFRPLCANSFQPKPKGGANPPPPSLLPRIRFPQAPRPDFSACALERLFKGSVVLQQPLPVCGLVAPPGGWSRRDRDFQALAEKVDKLLSCVLLVFGVGTTWFVVGKRNQQETQHVFLLVSFVRPAMFCVFIFV